MERTCLIPVLGIDEMTFSTTSSSIFQLLFSLEPFFHLDHVGSMFVISSTSYIEVSIESKS